VCEQEVAERDDLYRFIVFHKPEDAVSLSQSVAPGNPFIDVCRRCQFEFEIQKLVDLSYALLKERTGQS
jgi:hypothetical protein